MERTVNSIQIIENKITPDTVLFFDLDGTLIDTDLANFLAYKKAVISITKSHFELKYDPEQRFTRSTLKKVIPNLPEADYESITREKELCFNEFLDTTLLNTKIVALLLKYYKTNKTVLVTNCRKNRTLEMLKYYELEDKFSTILFRELNSNEKKINKFENAISKLDIKPESVIAFENEESEIADARKAGIFVINPLNL